MKVLILGSTGFIGKNLTYWLKERHYDVLTYNKENNIEELPALLKQADIIFNFVGVMRPTDSGEFQKVNFDFTEHLLTLLKDLSKKPPLVFTSSIQAGNGTPYGDTKKEAEDAIFKFSKEYYYPVYVYRLSNCFGKWCRPYYNSVIATWCYNISRSIPCTINKDNPTLKLLYIDDIMNEFIKVIQNDVKPSDSILSISPTYDVSLNDVYEIINSFKTDRESLFSPINNSPLRAKLYATYLSYLPEDDFGYDLVSHTDQRGGFTEFVKTLGDGQVSIVTSHPGVVRGNHYHHTKNEKFLIVKGECELTFRKLGDDKIFRYRVTSDHLRVIDIPVGYTHAIKNVGKDDAIIVIWASEVFDPIRPDTYALEVEHD